MRSLTLFRNFIWYSVTVVLAIALLQAANAQSLPNVPKDLIIYDSPEGAALFASSDIKNDFWPLSRYFETQQNLAYCGVASSVMTLNALGYNEVPFISALPDGPKLVTQDNLFTEGQFSDTVISAETVSQQGMTLEELTGILSSFDRDVSMHFADDFDVDEFRDAAIAALNQPGEFILVNFDRVPLYGQGPGHISPLAAYDEASDRFLMLDVARYSYPPVWVKTQDLYDAMHTEDSTSERYRGYVIVS